MPVDLSNILVVGISSRSLFSLEHENEIFNNAGVTAFRKYQEENENVILDPGPSFQLVKKLLDLNKISSQQVVEIVVMSSNSPQTGIRVMNSIKAHNLDITRMAFTGGQPISSYLPGFCLFLLAYYYSVPWCNSSATAPRPSAASRSNTQEYSM